MVEQDRWTPRPTWSPRPPRRSARGAAGRAAPHRHGQVPGTAPRPAARRLRPAARGRAWPRCRSRSHMPESLAGTGRPGPDDERLTTLLTRRSTLDWVLRRAVLAEPGMRCARRAGHRADARRGRAAAVTGVRTDDGDLRPTWWSTPPAAAPRSTAGWREIGARPTALRRAECGVAYFSRHYRLRPAADLPGLPTTRIVAGLDEFTAGLWGGDNGAMQLAVAPLAADHRFRAARAPRGLHRRAAHRPRLRGLARRPGPDQRCLPDGRAAQHAAPPRGRRRPGRHRAARDRRLGLHHQPHARPRPEPGPDRRRGPARRPAP